VPLPIDGNEPLSEINDAEYIQKVIFYQSESPDIYSDNNNYTKTDIACAAVMVDMSGKTIKVLYRDKLGTVKIIKGESSNGSCSISVEQGTFMASNSIVEKINISKLLSEPQTYLNKSFSIQGTLKLEGDLFPVNNEEQKFYLVNDEDQKANIQPWRPNETMIGPNGEKGESMSKYLNQKISIPIAILQKNGDQYIIKVPNGIGKVEIMK